MMETQTIDIETQFQNEWAFTALAFALIEDDKSAERIRTLMRKRYEEKHRAEKEVA